MSYIIQHKRLEKPGKESIHSGHFMVSQFEAEEQDDEDNVAVPIPEVIDTKAHLLPVKAYLQGTLDCSNNKKSQQQLFIDQSLAKLFQCMSLAYRQKLTSPKWNRFRGIRLRWKDKIRLNNVIWRCWHLQFIKKENTLICQFASPLDVDTHNKPEAIVLEGKYWKRKLAAVTAEYKKWRMFYRNHLCGHTSKEDMDMLNDVDAILGDSNSMDHMNMMIDEDYMGLMSDTLFSTITNQPFAFPDTRELAKSGFADFIQPSLGPLQPNLDDYMDTFEPLQELYANNKLPTVPEEQSHTWEQYRDYPELIHLTELSAQSSQAPTISNTPLMSQYSPQMQEMPIQEQPVAMAAGSSSNYNSSVMLQQQTVDTYIQNSNYPIVAKLAPKANHNANRGKLNNTHVMPYAKSMDASGGVYQNYNTQGVTDHVLADRVRIDVSIVKNLQPESLSSPVHELQSTTNQYNRGQGSAQSCSASAYKFASPGRPNVKFSSQTIPQVQAHQPQMMHPPTMHASQPPPYHSSFSPVQKDVKVEQRGRGAPRGGRGRSRSNTREPIKRPPLLSAVSDPSLITPHTNALLTQLLTTSSPLFTPNQSIGASASSAAAGSSDISQHIRVKEETSKLPVLPPPANTLISLPSQITVTTVPLSNGDSSYLGTYSNSNSPLESPSQNIHSPTSSQGSIGSPGREGSGRDRRVGHIHAEQKRRCNIKNGFDMIHSLIPQLNQNPNAKLSKAMMLQKGAEYIRQLRSERNQLREEMDSLRQQIETLNTSISNCQSMLPATGAPVSRRRDSRMQEMFDEYVSNRTMDNWKFWIFSLICRPLLNSFNNFVSMSSLEDLYSSTVLWVEQHCTLVDLRPVVLNSLRYLCTKTEILSEPEKLPDEARKLVLAKDKK